MLCEDREIVEYRKHRSKQKLTRSFKAPDEATCTITSAEHLIPHGDIDR